MASKSLQDILGWVALTKAVNAVKDGVPNPFPSWLFTVRNEDKIIGNSVKFNRTYGMRKTARVIRYGAAPRHRELQQEELVEAKFVSFGEERIFDPLVLQVLRNYDNFQNGQMAKQLVANNVKTMGTLFGNARIVAVATTLAKGYIYADSEGNLLPTSSGAHADFTFSQQIPAANIGTVVDGASANIFGASGGGSWATTTTDIPLQLTRLIEHAAQSHGYEPKVALYGKNIKSYLIQNNYVKDYMARNPAMQTQWLKDNTIPDGLFGMTWVPVWKASFTKDDGTKVSLWPADGITFLPGEEDAASLWSMFEGSNLVPTTIDIVPDAMAALAAVETVFGPYGYSQLNHKPISLSNVMGDTFLPAIKIPEAVYITDVVA